MRTQDQGGKAEPAGLCQRGGLSTSVDRALADPFTLPRRVLPRKEGRLPGLMSAMQGA